MAFHEIKIGSTNYTLAPKCVKTPETAATNADYGFLLFQHDTGDSSVCNLYSPGSFETPIIKYSSGNICAEGNILPANNNSHSVGSSSQKFNTMYATTFHGNLSGTATNATNVNVTTSNASLNYPLVFTSSVTAGNKRLYTDTANELHYNPSTKTLTTTTFSGNLNGIASSASKVLITTQTASDDFPIIFGESDSVTSTSVQSVHADAHLNYNPSTNTLTTTQVDAKLNGPVQTTNTNTNATYYISFVNSSSTGMRYTYVDAGLYYNPSTNELSAGGGFYERSDERLKDLQEDIEVNFSYLHNIPKKYYSWKDDATYTRHIGTSAQEVQKYYPELVNVDETGYLTMNYDKLSVVALKAIDVLHEEVAELKKENAELKERLARLEELILNR
jgi:hypothetical protein